MKFISRFLSLFCGLILISLASCSSGTSYSQLLREEEVAVNWYLAQNQVDITFPTDGSYLYGEDAPFYRMDGDGYVYMKILDPGNLENKPKKGDVVYFRFMRMNLKTYYETGSESWAGNAENMNSSYNGTSLTYGNSTLTSTTQYGDGIQVPLDYLGYDCHVMLIVKSPEGWSADISSCNPYLYTIRYFKAEY